MRSTITAAALLAALSLTVSAPAQVKLDHDTVGDRIWCFYPPRINRDALPPSIAVINPGAPRPQDPGRTLEPKYWMPADGRHCVRVDVPADTSLYGTGEVAGPLLRSGRTTTLWNTDAYGYTEQNPSLYQSHPWVLGVRKDGTAFGVLADTTWRCEIDLTGAENETQAGIVFRGEGGPAGGYKVYIIERDNPQDVVKALAQLTGTMPMPPKWAIGYHQCRYSYYPEARVREIAKEFRDRDIPCDVIWFDIDYMDGFRVFTFDKTHFPDPTKLNADLEADGFSCIWMIDPGVKAEAGYAVYDSGTQADVWVKDAAGKTYQGEVWPGWCVFPDYTRPEVRAWWADLYKPFMATGIDGVWNDMNEPAVFNVKSKTMPETNLHLGGAWSEGDVSGTLPRGPHLQYHNIYGTLMAKGTFDGILAANPDKRPFVLTRAGYLGSHRYAATWTGDNSAEWDDLEASVPMALNLGLSGQPFAGPDIGGFNGNGPAGKNDAETARLRGQLFARWMGFGALLPFARGHTGKGNIDKEPWSFGPEVEATCRRALQRRYRLLPYYYTLFHEASTMGLPVMRPLFFADPTDLALRTEDDAFLLGANLLVVPQLTPGRDRTPVVPTGDWRLLSLVEGDTADPDLPELRVHSGAIIPAGPIVESTRIAPPADQNVLTLYVALDFRGKATGTLYEDAGDGFGYRRGEYLLTTYSASVSGNSVVVKVEKAEGDMPRPDRRVEVVVLGRGKQVSGSGKDGQEIMVELPPSSAAPGPTGGEPQPIAPPQR